MHVLFDRPGMRLLYDGTGETPCLVVNLPGCGDCILAGRDLNIAATAFDYARVMADRFGPPGAWSPP